MSVLKKWMTALGVVAEAMAQSEPVTAEMIHDEFNTEGERLLREAEALLQRPQQQESMGERLARLGFTSTEAAVAWKQQKEKEDAAVAAAACVRRYNLRYPQHRFITEAGVGRICKKYGLVCGGVSKYIGTVPEPNIKEIENFRLSEEDMPEYLHHIWLIFANGERSEEKKQAEFLICAPPKNFNMTGAKLEGTRIVVEDPVVLCRVRDGYLIVSAWGAEASDDEVMSPGKN